MPLSMPSFSPPPVDCGFIPSLELLPLLAATRQDTSSLRFQGCPGYGRIIRQLLTGDLQAGVLPWELFVSEVLTRPGQADQWSVPLVIQTCPSEMVLSRAAFRCCFPPRTAAAAGPMPKLTFAIEGKRSLTRLQIGHWLSPLPGAARPRYKVLPLELMLKGLKADMIDGIVAPAPWGMYAEKLALGKAAPTFAAGPFAQHMVFICQKTVTDHLANLLHHLPAACLAARHNLGDEATLRATASWANAAGGPPLSAPLLAQSAARYLPSPPATTPPDFIPDAAWLTTELERLIQFQVLSPEGYSAALAQGLVSRPNHV